MTGRDESTTSGNASTHALSSLYRASLRDFTRLSRDSMVTVDDLDELAQRGSTSEAGLSRLALSPDALALSGVAKSARAWSITAAAEWQRSVVSKSRARRPAWLRMGWIPLAAAASLAVVMVGDRQSESMRPAGALYATPVVEVVDTDVVFADPDATLLASEPGNASDAIFVDSLDG